MAKRKKQTIRTAKNVDEKYLGVEPTLTEDSPQIDIINARNWYNYFHDAERAKKYVLDWLKFTKASKEDQKVFKSITKDDLYKVGLHVGWNARILTRGGSLPENIMTAHLNKIAQLREIAQSYITVEETPVTSNNTVSIQSRMRAKAREMIYNLEDKLYSTEEKFSPYEWLQANASSAAVAKLTIDRWKDELEEVTLAITKKDSQCVEAYSHYTMPQIRKLQERLQTLVDDIERFAMNTKKVRKPRKKKETPADKQVEKVQYQETDKDLKLQSINPVSIVGVDQLWTFNTKYRTLTVYNAIGPSGLSFKGTTLKGFDPKNSETRKLRKPEEILKVILKASKTKAIKELKSLTTKPSEPNGRINKDTILLKVNK